ncbi:O-antigen ligase family protein [Streptomyces sp. NPDC048057]|uniref:O-antigen ligase family protein n=1 Tax=Streptomyces sp. NPDC048057 TaxID=3155628 RepID=UPI0033D5D8DD
MAASWAAPRPRTAVAPGDVTGTLPLLPLLATVLLLAFPLAQVQAGGRGGLGPADVTSGALVLVGAAQAVRNRVRPLSVAAAVVIGAPAVAIALATVTAADPAAAVPGFVRYLQVFVLVPAAVLLVVRTARDFRLVIGAFVALALVQGAIGVHQYATGTGASYAGADIRAVGTFGPLDVMGMATVVAYGLLGAAALALGAGPCRHDGAVRPQGGVRGVRCVQSQGGGSPSYWTYVGDPDNAASVRDGRRGPGEMVTTRPSRADAPRWLRPVAAGAAVLLVVPLALSFSRGSWIATALAVLAVLLLSGARRAFAVLAVATAAAVVLVGGFGVGSAAMGERLGSITEVTDAPDRSVTDRYAMWAAAHDMWRGAPVTGVGLKGFPDHRDAHASVGLSSGSDTAGAGQEFQRQPLLSPHNMYLLILSEQGLVGATAFVGSWAALLVGGARRLARGRGARDVGLAAVALLLWQTVDFLYADIGGPSTVLTGVVLGLAARWALAPLPEADAA